MSANRTQVQVDDAERDECGEAVVLISSDAVEQLSADEWEFLRVHLDRCESCRGTALDPPDELSALGTQVGDYHLWSEFGRGAMGRLIAAHDRPLGRAVALKVVLDNSADAVARFEHETRVTAALQHPNIVPIYRVGRWPDDRPFYSMPILPGRTLAHAIESTTTLAERLHLIPAVIAAADAAAYAHSRGWIHRDLKPENILLGAFGEKIVGDWGLAKRIDGASSPAAANLEVTCGDQNAGLTPLGGALGTLPYASPEQVGGGPVDDRADVYALGAVLYHVLVGRPPYDGDSRDEMTAKVLTCQLPAFDFDKKTPQALRSLVRAAMTTNPEGRKVTAAGIAEDLRRFRNDERLAVHEYGPFQLLGRWIARHSAPIMTAAVALVVVLVTTMAAMVAWNRARSTEQRALLAEQQRQGAERRNQINNYAQAVDLAMRSHTVGPLAAFPERMLGWEANYILGLQRADPQLLRGHSGPIFGLAFSPDGTLVASGGLDRVVVIRSLEAGREVDRIPLRGEVKAVAFSPDGRLVAAVSSGLGKGSSASELVVYDRVGKTVVDRHDEEGITLWDVAFSPDGRWVAYVGGEIGTGGEGRLYGRNPFTKSAPWPTQPVGSRLFSVAFSPSGQELATGGEDHMLRLWNANGGKEIAHMAQKHEIRNVAYSRDGALIAAAGGAVHMHDTGEIVLWDARARRQLRSLVGHADEVWSVAFSPTADRLFSASFDGKVKVWDVATGRDVLTLEDHTDQVRALALTQNGQTLASAGEDGVVRLWVARPLAGTPTKGPHTDRVWSIAFQPGGALFATGSEDGTVKLWRTADQGLERVFSDPLSKGKSHNRGVSSVAFDPVGQRLVSASYDGTVKVWPVDGKAAPLRLGDGIPGWVTTVAFSADGGQVAAAMNHVVLVWDLKHEGRPRRGLDGHRWVVSCLAFSPDGRYLATGGWDLSVLLWDLRRPEADPRRLLGHTGRIRDLAFSPDSTRLATAANDGTVRLWSMQALDRAPLVLSGHEDAVLSVAFDRGGTRLMSAAQDQTIRIRNGETGATVETRSIHAGRLRDAALRPDGLMVAVALGEQSSGDFRLLRLESPPAATRPTPKRP